MSGHVRDEIFNRQFSEVLKKHTDEQLANAQKTYAEKVKREEYTYLEPRYKPQRF